MLFKRPSPHTHTLPPTHPALLTNNIQIVEERTVKKTNEVSKVAKNIYVSLGSPTPAVDLKIRPNLKSPGVSCAVHVLEFSSYLFHIYWILIYTTVLYSTAIIDVHISRRRAQS